MFNIKLRFCGLTSAALLLVTACASQPQFNAELEDAKKAVASAESDPHAQQSAAKELEEAKDSLASAEGAFQSNDDPEIIRYHAYMATRHAEIAKEQTADAQIREQIANAPNESNAIVLSARDRELQALKAEQTDRGPVLTLGDVLFDTARADLKPGAQVTIDRLASFLDENPKLRILVEGHADARGSDSYNLDLSQRRANSVAMALYNRGVTEDRVAVKSMGEMYPVASNDTAAGQQQNRRVEVVISSADGTFPVAARR